MKTTAKTKKLDYKKYLGKLWIFILLMLPGLNQVEAITTTPQIIIYEGQLLDNAGAPLAGNYDFRFSFWLRTDYIATDVVAGVINAAEPDYLGWEETQAYTTDADGFFTFEVGSANPWATTLLDHTNLFFQVEVKPAGSAVAGYELIDIDPSDITQDRTVVASVPHAFNADKLDFRELGFGAGQIPYLDGAGMLDATIIPFNINVDQVDGYDVGLNPGDIPYIDPSTGLISATILPSLPVTGTDNNTFTLDQDGNAGSTDDIVLQFGGALGETLTFDQVNDQFEFSNDLLVNGGLTVTGPINGVIIGPQDEDVVLTGRADSLIFEKDGTENDGSMYEELDTVLGEEKTIIRWDTDEATQQDYDAIIRYVFPQNLDSLRTPALSLDYMTTSVAADTKIDFTVVRADTPGVDLLAGAGMNLNAVAWTKVDFNLPATLVAGDAILLKARMYARNGTSSNIGDIKLQMVTN